MKQIIIAYFLPALVSVFFLNWLINNKNLNDVLFKKQVVKTSKTFPAFIANFEEYPEYETHFLESNDSSENIFLLGSSELTTASEAIPFNFISANFRTQVKAVGHAGNQCFSIYSQLLANEERLQNAPVVIILSPMWFFSQEANGTSSKVFLEFNSARFSSKIIANDSVPEFKAYEEMRISKMFTDFSSPHSDIKQFHFEHQSSKSPLHFVFFKSLMKINKLLTRTQALCPAPIKLRKDIVQDDTNINWDSLLTFSKQEMLANATNNNWGIDNDYFKDYTKGETKKIKVVPESANQELHDFKMLIKLLKAKKVNASFIIIPMNPFFYSNLKDATPLINILAAEIKKANYPCLNYWVTDPSKYEKGILKDVMHLSPYGWYNVDRFIIETYHLHK